MKGARSKLPPMFTQTRLSALAPQRRIYAIESRRHKAAGFSVLELMITIAIGAILLTIGVGSFSYVTKSNRSTAEVNGLLGDLQYARAEAIKEGVNVTACASLLGLNCDGTTSWQNGWIVFSDTGVIGTVDGTDTVLRIQRPLSGTDTFTASNAVSKITFNREGYATGIANGTLITLHDSTNNQNFTRCLSVSFIGLLTTQRYGGTCL